MKGGYNLSIGKPTPELLAAPVPRGKEDLTVEWLKLINAKLDLLLKR